MNVPQVMTPIPFTDLSRLAFSRSNTFEASSTAWSSALICLSR
ncbi:hypothetical protein PS627_04592 [Pseudomonas fluorescens]|nr:hypothetical protein PS627_01153 [Pseudomonas fluorescens]CAG8870261.1 hypothetical protein PS627_03936 [Pseudomonas fluorescens]CAG8871714.1 hypothetical protein PS627_04592 [Pseudomonas fluorescens]